MIEGESELRPSWAIQVSASAGDVNADGYDDVIVGA